MPAKSFDLGERTILVTGAAGHLGRAICLQLAAAGARVVLNGRTVGTLEAVAQEIRQAGGAAEVLAFDLTDQAATSVAVATVQRLDGIVNNAYGRSAGTIAFATRDAARQTLEASLVAPFFLVQECLPSLRSAPGGAAIVNIASMYGSVSPDPRIYADPANASSPFYGASKGGLIQLTRYLACHLAPERIRVNAVSPGPFPPASLKANDPAFHDRLVDKVPMGRIGAANEVASAVQFLLSDAASYITGVDLPVDGGWTAGSN